MSTVDCEAQEKKRRGRWNIRNLFSLKMYIYTTISFVQKFSNLFDLFFFIVLVAKRSGDWTIEGSPRFPAEGFALIKIGRENTRRPSHTTHTLCVQGCRRGLSTATRATCRDEWLVLKLMSHIGSAGRPLSCPPSFGFESYRTKWIHLFVRGPT